MDQQQKEWLAARRDAYIDALLGKSVGPLILGVVLLMAVLPPWFAASILAIALLAYRMRRADTKKPVVATT
jgi:hypothetical protein